MKVIDSTVVFRQEITPDVYQYEILASVQQDNCSGDDNISTLVIGYVIMNAITENMMYRALKPYTVDEDALEHNVLKNIRTLKELKI